MDIRDEGMISIHCRQRLDSVPEKARAINDAIL